MNLRAPSFPVRPSSGVRARAWAVMDRGSTRPGYRLTPERLWAAFRQAEAGQPLQQNDLIEDVIETDGHTRGQYLQRMGVADRPVALAAGDGDESDGATAAAEALSRPLGRTNLEEALWHWMDALFFGYSGTEIEWAYDRKVDLVLPRWFHCVEHRRFVFDLDFSPRLMQEDNAWPGEALVDGKWVWSQKRARIPTRAGIGRTIASWCLVKRLEVRDWIVFAEKFGLPLPVGTYEPRVSAAAKAGLRYALESIGTDGYVMLEDGCRMALDMVSRNGDVSALHPKIIELANAEISKVIQGATLTTESGGPGSFALGKVHQTRSDALTFADAVYLQRLFRRYIAEPFMAFNPKFGDVAPPELYIHVQPEQDPLTDIQVAKTMWEMGMELDQDQIHRRTGWRRPTSPRNALKPAPPPAPPLPPGAAKPGAKKPAAASLEHDLD